MSPRSLVLGLVLLVIPQVGAAGPNACVHQALADAFAEGWVTHTVRVGPLEAGGTRDFVLTLQGGSEYTIQSCGSVGLELMLYDGDGHVVTRSHSADGPAVVTYSPARTRRYHVVAYARDADASTRDVSLAVTYR